MKTILPKATVRKLNREIDRASNALLNVMDIADELIEKLDREDARAMELHASDDLESVRDDAEDAETTVSRLFDLTEKLRRYERIARKS